METLINFVLLTSDWSSNGIGLLSVFFMRGKHWWAPWIAVFSEIFWVILSVQTQKWGMLAATCVYAVLYVRMGIGWYLDSKKAVPHG